MKINKVPKSIPITNPFRPPARYPRNYTICRITESSLIAVDEAYTTQVDADFSEKFWAKFSSIPYPEKYYDPIFEMWFVTQKWNKKVKTWAKQFYDEVHVEMIDNTVERIKKRNATKPKKVKK